MKLKLSVSDIALKLEVDEAVVRRWEAGVSLPDFQTMTRISELFGMPVDDLLKNRKSTSNFSYYTVPNEDKKGLSPFKIVAFGVFFLAVMGLLTLWTISLVSKQTYVSDGGETYTGFFAYYHGYVEFRTLTIAGAIATVLSGLALAVPDPFLEKIFGKKD